MVNGLFPVVTIVLSLALYHSLPTRMNLLGILLALAAIVLMAFDEVKPVEFAQPAPFSPWGSALVAKQ
jgi:drug/metabolite transporter (DMT)-like permease